MRGRLQPALVLRAVARLGLKAFYALAALLAAGNALGQSQAPRIRFALWTQRWRQIPLC